MTKHHGDLRITNENLENYQTVTEVAGSVDIMADNTNLPALTKSGGVDINAANASLPALTKSGVVYINGDNAILPALTKSGAIFINADNASLPALTLVSGWVSIYAANASLPALTEVSGSVYIMVDNTNLPVLLKTITAVEGGVEFQWGDHKLSATGVYVRSTVKSKHNLSVELGENLKYHAGCFHGSYKEAVKRIDGRADYTDALKQLRKALKGWSL